jgi:hypothetical protein
MGFWRGSKFRWGGGLILCLIVVVVAVRGSGGSVDEGGPTMSPTLVPSTAPSASTSPSTAPSFAFEVLLAQSLPTNSQDAILIEGTPEAQAFALLQDDPGDLFT